MFKIGENIICINTGAINSKRNFPKLIKGKIYTVLASQFCQSCGKQSIDVGTTYSINKQSSPNYNCNICNYSNKKIIKTPCSVFRFRRLDKDTLAEMVTNEEYELAEIIHKFLETNLIEK